MLTFGSLFAGIGGLDLGLERAGMQCKWQVEIDEFCLKVLEKHWPNVKRFKDIKDCGKHNLEPVDLICGGFPCQPVSVAGKKKAQADIRWLWPEFYRIIRLLRPRYALLENVPGLLSVSSGGAMAEILGDLAESGYDCQWDCIPAAAVGAPHLRYRVFIVGYSQHTGFNASQITRSIGERGNYSTPRTKQARELEGSSKQYEDVADAEGDEWSQQKARNGGKMLTGRGEEIPMADALRNDHRWSTGIG